MFEAPGLEPLPTSPAIDRAVFTRDFARPRRPVLIRGAVAHWGALARWTPSFFRDRFGDRPVRAESKSLSFGELVDAIEASTPSQPAPYLHNHYIYHHLPEVVADIEPLPEIWRGNLLQHARFPHAGLLPDGKSGLFLGGQGASFPVLHRDTFHTHAFVTQVFGTKLVWLYGPDQTERVYPNPEVPTHSRIDHPHDPDLKRFPDFAEVRGYTGTLTPGDTLFIPAWWWHTTYMPETSISVSVNYVDATNRWAFLRDIWRERDGRRPLRKLTTIAKIATLAWR